MVMFFMMWWWDMVIEDWFGFFLGKGCSGW